MERKNFQTIAWFWDLYQRGLLDLDPPYQRRSVWNQPYKDYFVETVLLSYPAPAIFVYEEITAEGTAKYHVVDGKQRLTTIFEFVTDRFPLSDTSKLASIRGSYFSQLEPDVKRKFWTYSFSVEYVPSPEEGVLNDIFDRLNRNIAKLTPQELRHARFGGEFIATAENLSEWMERQLPQNFPRIAAQSRRQMKDVELTSQLLLLIEKGPSSYTQDELDEAYANRDTSWEQRPDVEDLFRNTVAVLKNLVDHPIGNYLQRTRLQNQADFYSLFGAVAQLLKESQLPTLPEVAERLRDFITIVEDEERRRSSEDAKQYYEAARSASNDVGPRRTRVSIMKKVLLAAADHDSAG